MGFGGALQDIDAVVGQVVPAIGAAVSAYGLGVLTRAEDEAAGATVRLGQRLLARLLRRGAEPDPVRAAVVDLTRDRLDADALAALRLQIRRVLTADPDLVQEVMALLPPVTARAVESRGVVLGGENSGIISTGDGAMNIQRS